MNFPKLINRTWSAYYWCKLQMPIVSLKVSRNPSPLAWNNGSHNCRCMSSERPENIMNVFNRKVKRMQKNRTASLPDYKVYDYIKDEIGYRMFDRICDVKRKFGVAVDLGCGRGYVSKYLQNDMVDQLYMCEFAEKLLMQAELPEDVPTQKLIVDEEYFPFKPNSLDLVVSCLSLHWVNDLPGCFKQINNALKNDGVFIGCMFGGETLFQLRVALQLAETEREGGFAPHISPFTEVQDLGNLLNRAGYTMLTIDVDEIEITYPSINELMQDLQGMGESNCSHNRKAVLHRETINLAGEKYKEMYGDEKGVPATFQIINFIGWKPDVSQAQPAKRGSGQISLKDLDKVEELIKDINKLRDNPSNPNSSDTIDPEKPK